MNRPRTCALALLGVLALVFFAGVAHAHDVTDGDKAFIHESTGILVGPFVYLGAKHMVTGYDHLLFLVGVIFFLYRLRDVATYVTLFAVGHSVTLLAGVVLKVEANAHLIDAIIGLSVVYKALDNLGTLRRWLGFQPSTKAATLAFGLCHGFGLAAKLLEFEMPAHGVMVNLVAFNVGVELGQLCALYAILIAMSFWRRTESFARYARVANVALLSAGLALAGMQLAGYCGSDVG